MPSSSRLQLSIVGLSEPATTTPARDAPYHHTLQLRDDESPQHPSVPTSECHKLLMSCRRDSCVAMNHHSRPMQHATTAPSTNAAGAHLPTGEGGLSGTRAARPQGLWDLTRTNQSNRHRTAGAARQYCRHQRFQAVEISCHGFCNNYQSS